VSAAVTVHRPLSAELELVAAAYDEIVLLLAPPRTASTALARVFWGHDAISFYAHEPFDRSFHEGAPLGSAATALLEPLDLRGVLGAPDRGFGLLVKEMTFQAGNAAAALMELATRPVVFLIRDPRLAVWSRMRMLGGGSEPVPFPPAQTGWVALAEQVRHCRLNRIDYTLLDASDMRRAPHAVLGALLERLGFDYSPELLSWRPVDVATLGGLGDAQRHWYRRILESSGLEPPTEPLPPLERFPAEHGLREHVEWALDVYAELRQDPRFVAPPERARTEAA
jgi:Sulfotransferase domain